MLPLIISIVLIGVALLGIGFTAGVIYGARDGARLGTGLRETTARSRRLTATLDGPTRKGGDSTPTNVVSLDARRRLGLEQGAGNRRRNP